MPRGSQGNPFFPLRKFVGERYFERPFRHGIMPSRNRSQPGEISWRWTFGLSVCFHLLLLGVLDLLGRSDLLADAGISQAVAATLAAEEEKSMELNEMKGPAIIISSSGMCEAGRVRHHLSNHLGDARNLVLFVGYCAQNTLGARIVAGDDSVKIFGEPHKVRASVKSIDAFSGHADRDELLAYFKNLGGHIKRICVVHGEEEQSFSFAELLREVRPKADVIVPKPGQKIEF